MSSESSGGLYKQNLLGPVHPITTDRLYVGAGLSSIGVRLQ